METSFEALEKAHSAIARERVLTDLQTLTRDAEGLLKATAGDVSDKVKEARLRVAEAIERAKATCVNLQQQTVETAKMAARKVDTFVRERPYQAVGIALAAGLLIGGLRARR